LPELRVYAATAADRTLTLTAGIADAVAIDEMGRIEAVVDWKSDVDRRRRRLIPTAVKSATIWRLPVRSSGSSSS